MKDDIKNRTIYTKTISKPLFRFSEFNDKWKQRKLGNILKYEQPTKYIVESTNYDNTFNTPVLTAGQSFILGYTDETKYVKEASENDPVIIFDDFTTASHYVDFPFKIKSSAMKLLTLKEENEDFYFVYNILKNINYNIQNHERHWISKFSEFKVSVPSIKEQAEIGSFFSYLDNLISLKRRELNLLNTQKQTLLSKMFPKGNEVNPEIRFKGFTDNWKQHKLRDVFQSFEYGLNSSATEYDGENKYIRITDIDENSRLFKEDAITSPKIDFALADKFLLKKGDVLFARTGASVGKTYRYRESDGKVYYAGYLIRGRIHMDFDSEFIFQNTFTQNYINFIKITSQRSGQPGINAQEYASFELMIPNAEEQARIGLFFKQLDDTITLHQRELDIIKEMKKTLLKNMFV